MTNMNLTEQYVSVTHTYIPEESFYKFHVKIFKIDIMSKTKRNLYYHIYILEESYDTLHI